MHVTCHPFYTHIIRNPADKQMLCHSVYEQNIWHPVCSQIIRKLVFMQIVCHLVYWFIGLLVIFACVMKAIQ